MAPTDERLNILAQPLRDELDAPVGKVADPTAKPVGPGLLDRVSTIEDPLDPPVYERMNPNDFRL